MNIFVFSDGVRHGCYVYREEIPLEALERRGHSIDGGDAVFSKLDNTDLFIFPRMAAMDYPLVIDDIRRRGKALVYEMDDAADLFERHHTSYFQVRNLIPSYYFFLHEADLVTTTTTALADHFRSLGAKNVVVLPNCPAPNTTWHPAPDNRKVRIGFSGWTAHLLDAAIWLEIIDSLYRLRQDFTPVLFGIASKGEPSMSGWLNKCRDAVNSNPEPNRQFGMAIKIFRDSWLKVKDYLEFHCEVPFDEYANKLASIKLDIGCALLEDTPFNNHKSCVKFYDFAAAGAVTLASDVLPYNEEPVVAVPNSTDAWVRMLSMYIDSKIARQQRLHTQREWIIQNRDADKWAVNREQAYQLLITRPTSATM